MATVRKNNYQAVVIPALLWWAVQSYILHNIAGFGWTAVSKDCTVTTLTMALSGWAIYELVRSYPTSVFIILYALFVSTLLSVIGTAVNWQVVKWVFSGTNLTYILWVHHTLYLRFFIFWLVNGWIATYTALSKKTSTLESKFQLHADAATLLREAELFKLRQQLQPHFLYNSLNSISALVMLQPDKAQEMIGKLSDFLRSSVKREAQDKIKIDDELEYIQSYLAIEVVRFGDRLQIAFEKDYTDDATIPPFLLQPVLENAIKFGLYGKTGSVLISICIALQASFLIITITNPYDSQGQPPGGTGFGLEGIRRRLYLLYARTDLLEVNKDNERFTTILKIPQAYVQGDTDR